MLLLAAVCTLLFMSSNADGDTMRLLVRHFSMPKHYFRNATTSYPTLASSTTSHSQPILTSTNLDAIVQPSSTQSGNLQVIDAPPSRPPPASTVTDEESHSKHSERTITTTEATRPVWSRELNEISPSCEVPNNIAGSSPSPAEYVNHSSRGTSCITVWNHLDRQTSHKMSDPISAESPSYILPITSCRNTSTEVPTWTKASGTSSPESTSKEAESRTRRTINVSSRSLIAYTVGSEGWPPSSLPRLTEFASSLSTNTQELITLRAASVTGSISSDAPAENSSSEDSTLDGDKNDRPSSKQQATTIMIIFGTVGLALAVGFIVLRLIVRRNRREILKRCTSTASSQSSLEIRCAGINGDSFW